MPWVTVDQVRLAVRSVLGLGPDARLPEFWAEPTEAGTAMGKVRVQGALADRGFTPAQVAIWDGLGPWHRIAALYHTFAEANLDDERTAAALARYEELLKGLATTAVTAGGEALVPGASGGNVSHGGEDTPDRQFTRDSVL